MKAWKYSQVRTIYTTKWIYYMLYTFWTYFSIRIQWWCPFHDRTNHIWWFPKYAHIIHILDLFFNMNSIMMSVSWSDQPYKVISQICTYYTYSGPIFQYEFNGDVCFMIGLTIYGNLSSMHILYTFWIYFSMQIWWWCLFHDRTNHIWWFLKYAYIIHILDLFFNMNSMVMSVSWLD